MSYTMLNIPKTITVGFQNRSDTYTQKLAYVIYTDEKGVLRKENSWNGWRDEKIDPQTFDNKPTEGFVLNRKVGGTRDGWNPRQTYVRVYDPRGFEFEITIPNLLFILEECTSTKGKGLEGEFVYSWDGKDIVLLPISSKEYQSSTNFTLGLSKKVKAKDLTEGCVYKTKKMKELVYLGKHDIYEKKYIQDQNITTIANTGNFYVFQPINETDSYKNYSFLKDLKSISEQCSKEVISDFANRYNKFTQSIYSKNEWKVVVEEYKLNPIEIKGQWFYNQYIKYRGEILIVRIDSLSGKFGVVKKEKYDKIEINKLTIKYYEGSSFYSRPYGIDEQLDIYNVPFVKIYFENQHRNKINL